MLLVKLNKAILHYNTNPVSVMFSLNNPLVPSIT